MAAFEMELGHCVNEHEGKHNLTWFALESSSFLKASECPREVKWCQDEETSIFMPFASIFLLLTVKRQPSLLWSDTLNHSVHRPLVTRECKFLSLGSFISSK